MVRQQPRQQPPPQERAPAGMTGGEAAAVAAIAALLLVQAAPTPRLVGAVTAVLARYGFKVGKKAVATALSASSPRRVAPREIPKYLTQDDERRRSEAPSPVSDRRIGGRARPRPSSAAGRYPERSEGHAARHQQARREASYRAAFVLNSSRRIQRQIDANRNPLEAVDSERRYWKMHLQAQKGREAAAEQVDRIATLWGDLLGWYAERDERTTPECQAANGKNFRASEVPLIGYPGTVHPNCRCKAGPPHAGAQMVDEVITQRRYRALEAKHDQPIRRSA